jgi:hypothetical protein
MRECVKRVHYEEAIATLGTEIEQKAYNSTVHALETRQQATERELSQTVNGLSIVSRFVQWFTERGDSYEHNLQIIDGHLRNLVKNQSPLLSAGGGAYPSTLLPTRSPIPAMHTFTV